MAVEFLRSVPANRTKRLAVDDTETKRASFPSTTETVLVHATAATLAAVGGDAIEVETDHTGGDIGHFIPAGATVELPLTPEARTIGLRCAAGGSSVCYVTPLASARV